MSPQFSEEDIEQEQVHFSNVVATFKQYAQYSLTANNRRRKDLYTLPHADKELLDSIGYRSKLQEIDTAILANANFLHKIVANPEIFGHDVIAGEDGGMEEDVDLKRSSQRSLGFRGQGDESCANSHSHDRLNDAKTLDPRKSHGQGRGRYKATDFDMDKLRSTLKQFVRDWSEDGKAERDSCYEPMKRVLEEYFKGRDRRTIRVLVPGAGLGRLAYDVAKLGFACQGNEFSHYMLLSSYLILNKTESIGEYTIYPYIHSFSNIPSKNALLRPVKIPDILPSDLPPGTDFSLVAGDFEEIYGTTDTDESEPHAGQWDAVLTCFFIDTAKNIVSYLRVIHRILAPGGVWINLGPLLWHFENNNTNDPSIELDSEEVKALARKIGFRLSSAIAQWVCIGPTNVDRLQDERTIETSYTSNDQSMLGYIYKAAFWKATKD
ncbi:putative carnosine N-methyltransferase [Butyriboletus roseoflavus]|nr:putative carnosine N-methyltransferase [Butyriboletus roseoflavus]